MDVILALKKEQEEGVVDIDSREDEEAEKVVKQRKRKKKAFDPHYRKRACVDCTKRCVRIHGRVCSSSGNKARPVSSMPSFFKVMVGYFSDNMVRTIFFRVYFISDFKFFFLIPENSCKL
jgi:hypothetical protein